MKNYFHKILAIQTIIVLILVSFTAISPVSVYAGDEGVQDEPTPSCLIPDSVGDNSGDVIGSPYGEDEKTIGEILDEAGYSGINSLSDQKQYQTWNTEKDKVNLNIKFLDRYAAQNAVFGYYRNGDTGTFIPVFRSGAVTGYESVPAFVKGDSVDLEISGASSVSFAIITQSGETQTLYSTENSKNAGDDHALVYHVEDNKYIIGFEDLNFSHSDKDYNDIVVIIDVTGCEDFTCDPSINLIKNGSFEEPVVSGWDIFDSVAGWTINWFNGSVSYESHSRPEVALLEIQKNVSGWLPSEGEQYAELDTDWDGPGGSINGEPASVAVWQNIETIPGKTYTFSFDFSHRPNTSADHNKLGILWGGEAVTGSPFTAVGTSTEQTQWQNYTFELTATSSLTSVIFRDEGVPNSFGTFLDNVALYCQSETQPPVEPEKSRIFFKKYITGQGPASYEGENAPTFKLNITGGPSGDLLLNNANDYQNNSDELENGNISIDVYEVTSAEDQNSEIIPADEACVAGRYRFDGYSVGTSFTDAASQATTTGHLFFTNIDADKYVIVWNQLCENQFVDLEVSKISSVSTVKTDTEFDYTITVKNNSNITASGVEVSDVLDSNLSFISATSTKGSYATSTSKWTIGNLATNEEVTLTLTTKAISEGNVVNTAIATSAEDDSNPSDNASTINVNINNEDNPPVSPPGDNGGGGIGGHRHPVVIGEILGATSCLYLRDYLKIDWQNDPIEVLKLQSFLNVFEGESLSLTGVFNVATFKAVERFQLKYSGDILEPWGENVTTGFVYILTKKRINEIYCNTTFSLSQADQNEINAFRDSVQGSSVESGIWGGIKVDGSPVVELEDGLEGTSPVSESIVRNAAVSLFALPQKMFSGTLSNRTYTLILLILILAAVAIAFIRSFMGPKDLDSTSTSSTPSITPIAEEEEEESPVIILPGAAEEKKEGAEDLPDEEIVIENPEEDEEETTINTPDLRG